MVNAMALVPALDLRPVSDEPQIAHTPHNLEAEQALLGCLLFDNAVFERLGDYLQARHFYEPLHARLFAAIDDHIRKGQLAEPIMLVERFKFDPAFEELGGVRYLALLVDRAPPAANAPELSEIPPHVTAKITVKPVRTVEEVLDIALVGSLAAAKKAAAASAVKDVKEETPPPRRKPTSRPGIA